MSADAIIRSLGLLPHPEGGHFRETFRDSRNIAGRSTSTAILYLLKQGEVSRWHRVDAVEIWHWYAGAPLELGLSPDGRAQETRILGNALAEGHSPQVIVPAGCWQMARSRGEFTLVGCTVAPGFEFSGFEMAEPGWAPRG
ncbi:MAG: cupin domain-containing protein [Alphaproteobacteria bacterium]|jgi:predicted cupin superfamily sugar epimerase